MILRHLARGGAALLALLLVLAVAPARAHVLLDRVEPRGDGSVDLVFSFDHGCAGQEPTDALTLTVPDHTAVISASGPRGWRHVVEDGTVSWTGPGIADGTRAEFVVTARVGARAGETVRFPAVQSCEGAAPYAWDDPADGDPEPAPRFVATTATTDTALHPVAKDVRESGAGPAAVAFAIALFVAASVLLAGWVRRRGH